MDKILGHGLFRLSENHYINIGVLKTPVLWTIGYNIYFLHKYVEIDFKEQVFDTLNLFTKKALLHK